MGQTLSEFILYLCRYKFLAFLYVMYPKEFQRSIVAIGVVGGLLRIVREKERKSSVLFLSPPPSKSSK